MPVLSACGLGNSIQVSKLTTENLYCHLTGGLSSPSSRHWISLKLFHLICSEWLHSWRSGVKRDIKRWLISVVQERTSWPITVIQHFLQIFPQNFTIILEWDNERSEYNMPVIVKLWVDLQYPEKRFQSKERKSQRDLATFSYLSGYFYINWVFQSSSWFWVLISRA